MGIIKRSIKKQVKKARKKAGLVNVFVPGLGLVVNEVADAYEGLIEPDKTKLHKLKGKKAKMDFLKQFIIK